MAYRTRTTVKKKEKKKKEKEGKLEGYSSDGVQDKDDCKKKRERKSKEKERKRGKIRRLLQWRPLWTTVKKKDGKEIKKKRWRKQKKDKRENVEGYSPVAFRVRRLWKVRVCQRERVSESEWVSEWVNVCVCKRERARARTRESARESERERERVCVCACVCVCERECKVTPCNTDVWTGVQTSVNTCRSL